MCKINTGSGTVTYRAIRRAMGNEPFTMSLVDTDEIGAVVAAVNEGIDSHLEACFCPERGDSYDGGERKAGKLVFCRTLECSISPESLPVLLRRLCESDFGDTETENAGMRLAADILMVLGFNDSGKFVGREVMGLA
ncbi:MAG: hypothetical protein ACLQNE_09450 [Thermoguttaceae bacterium]